MSKGSNIWITDRYGIDLVPMDDDKKSEFISTDNEVSTLVGNRSLLTKLAASHWGYVNKNGFYYDPTTVDGSIPTWTTPFQKPVLTYHPSGSEDKAIDPIGRIVGAKYINGVAKPFVEDDLIPNNIPDGYIELLTRISDPEAIPKVIDRRYDTVSISAVASNVVCSICGESVGRKDSKCKHTRFTRYAEDGTRSKNTGKLCHYKAGPLLGRHVAFVISPSDVYAGVKEAEWEGEIHDSESVLSPMALMELFIYSEDDKLLMSLNDSDSTNLFDKLSNDRDKAMIFDMFVLDTDTTNRKEGGDVTKLTTDDIQVMTDAEIDAKLVEDAECLSEDAKLSTAARKKLPDSAFCGPGRSFPANDAAHVRAGLRLLNKAKASGSTKSKILACLRSRATKYGIKAGAKVSSDSESDWTLQEITIIDTLLCDASIEDILELDIVKDHIDKHYTAKVSNADGSNATDNTSPNTTDNTASGTDGNTDAIPKVDAPKVDTTPKEDTPKVDTTDSTPATKDDAELGALRKQLADRDTEIAAITADKAEIYKSYKSTTVDRIIDFKINSREIVAGDREKQSNELMERSIESLNDTLKDLQDNIGKPTVIKGKVESKQIDGGRDPNAIITRSDKITSRRQRLMNANFPELVK